MLFLIVKEIENPKVDTVLTVALRVEQNDEKNIDENGVIKGFDTKSTPSPKLWLRFFPRKYGKEEFYAAEYRDIIEIFRKKNLDDLAVLVLNKTKFAINIINQLIANPDPKKPTIKNFCIFPKDCLLSESTVKENLLWFKAIKACEWIADLFAQGLKNNKLEEHDLIKHLLGENNDKILIKPESISVQNKDWKLEVEKHHNIIKTYLNNQGIKIFR